MKRMHFKLLKFKNWEHDELETLPENEQSPAIWKQLVDLLLSIDNASAETKVWRNKGKAQPKILTLKIHNKY